VLAASESEDIGKVMAQVILIMPELHGLCGESAPPLSVVNVEVDSLGSSAVASTPPCLEPSQSLDFVDSEICELLVSLEAAIPGSSKEVACLFSEKATEGKIKKVKKYQEHKEKE
jgi:hypothetical protein